MRYVVVNGESAAELTRRVETYLCQGWRITGGVATAVSSDSFYGNETQVVMLYQALISLED